MKIVGTDAPEVERALLAGGLACPGCTGRLRPWGHARVRVVRHRDDEERRRPRRTRCGRCALTHVLLAEDCLLRRRDDVEVIGAALAAKAVGHGQRRIARDLGRLAPTVRNWLRRFSAGAAAIRTLFTVLAHDLDPMLGPIEPAGSAVADAVEAIAAAARAAVGRLGPRHPWLFASAATGGRLLSNTSCLYRGVA
ncbi:MAG: helix-turn-helix domain-containing protein [Acidimicrobiales bacterium]